MAAYTKDRVKYEESTKRHYIIIKPGDTLSGIAKASAFQEYTSGVSYQKLAEINGISNPNLIYDGKKLYLNKGSGGGSSSSSTTSANTNQAIVDGPHIQNNTDNKTLFATWEWHKHSTTEEYRVRWLYGTGDGIAFVGTDTTTKERHHTFSIPDQASTRIIFYVMPISKTKTDKNNKTTNLWNAKWSEPKYFYISEVPPEKPNTPSVKMKDNTLTAKLDNISNANEIDGIQFQVVRDDEKVFASGTAKISTNSATFSCAVKPGGSYKVRCRAFKGKLYSEWTEYSDNADSGPAAPSEIKSLKALSKTSIQITWTGVKNADSYTIEYTTKKIYFDSSDEVESKDVDASSFNGTYIIEGLESGNEYFFRLRAVKGDHNSTWTAIKSIIIGKAPSAPTTWASSTTVVTGEPLKLYWVHNSEDGSSQKFAKIETEINGVKRAFDWINDSYDDEDERDKTGEWTINTSTYSEGTTIKWRVCTAGATEEYGEWSVQRIVEIYSKPVVEFRITSDKNHNIPVNRLESFPLYVYMSGTVTSNQNPVSYHVAVVSNDTYETVDNIGKKKMVSEGQTIYSKYIDIAGSPYDALLSLSAGHVDLESGMSYTVYCTAAMSSGLTADAHANFTVSWTENRYEPNAEISIDPETYSAYIRPYCDNKGIAYHEVSRSSNLFTKTTTKVNMDNVDGVYTDTDERVYLYKKSNGSVGYYCCVYDETGMTVRPMYYEVNASNGYVKTNILISDPTGSPVLTGTGEEVLLGILNGTTEIFYCEADSSTLIEGVTLSVYRREYDGSFTELATGLQNEHKTFITDPHPALDYARYRIVAIDTGTDGRHGTGAVSFYDVPGYPVNGTAAIIQWEEEWSTFDTSVDDPLAQPAWSGSMIKLLYNIDVSDSYSSDVEFVEYAGRTRPVSYYGTHVGETSTWNVEIPRHDEETLYALRRLNNWMGDVYVREPSGSGYWASVTVSFSQKHRTVTIPVTINITRVEGGV